MRVGRNEKVVYLRMKSFENKKLSNIENAKLKSQQDKMGNKNMKDISQIKTALAFKVKAKRQWKVLSNKKELQELCGPEKEINLDDVRAFLEHTKTYYLNEYGLTIQMNGKRVTKQDSTYQFARLDEYTKGNREPIFAWSKKKKDGEFGCANFGTRYDFDCIIVDSIKQEL